MRFLIQSLRSSALVSNEYCSFFKGALTFAEGVLKDSGDVMFHVKHSSNYHESKLLDRLRLR